MIIKKIVNIVKKKIENIIISRQGGQATSAYLRKATERRNSVKVGYYSYGGCFKNDFCIGGSVVIGRYCSFGNNVHYYGANHPVDFFSTSPYFYRQEWADRVSHVKVQDVQRYRLYVGNDCWIGSNVTITCGCTKIGNGAVIGAGSVVTKDVEPYSIVAGNPAKHIKIRFPYELQQKLEESKWFEKDPDVILKCYYQHHSDILSFANAVIKNNEVDNINNK